MPVFVNAILVSVEACTIGTYSPHELCCINCTNGLTTQATAKAAKATNNNSGPTSNTFVLGR